VSTLPPQYPANLLCNGRAADNYFELDEKLYIFTSEYVDEGGRIEGVDLRPPDISTNRSKYSAPADVLFSGYPRYLGFGVAESLARDIPPTKVDGNGNEYEFVVEHDPTCVHPTLPDNYSHTEIRGYRGLTRQKQWPPKVRREFKQSLAEKFVVVRRRVQSSK
jgi:hypothetical protein